MLWFGECELFGVSSQSALHRNRVQLVRLPLFLLIQVDTDIEDRLRLFSEIVLERASPIFAHSDAECGSQLPL